MPLAKRITWSEHKANWSNCDKCILCETRTKIVLYRGKLPCEILLIGEAPGDSEDSLGSPFKGPAGIKLDEQIAIASERVTRRPDLGFTNLVACLPITVNEKREPSKDEIKKCSPRLLEIFTIAKPRYVLPVGNLSKQYLPRLLPRDRDCQIWHPLVHPAAILRADEPMKTQSHLQNIARIASLFEEVQS